MALTSVSTNNKFLPSAESNDFIHGSEADRYKTFVSQINNSTIAVADARILDMAMRRISTHIAGISPENKANMSAMLLGGIASALGLNGNIMNRVMLSKVIDTICGDFDVNIYFKYGLNLNFVDCLSLSGLLSSLLCMGVKNALSSTFNVANSMSVDPRLLACVVGSTLTALGFNPNKDITIGIAVGNFKSTSRVTNNTRIDVNNIIANIRDDDTLLGAFRNTKTAETLMTGSQPSETFSDDLDALLPEWSPDRLSGSANVGNNLMTEQQSKALSEVPSLTKYMDDKEFMMLVNK